MRRARGFTVAEVLTVLVIVGLLLGAIATAMPMFLKIPAAAQSQVDNVESTALALYRMQRDARQSNINAVYACTTTPQTACSKQAAPAGATPPPVDAIVMLSANLNGQFQVSAASSGGNPNAAGTPQWQGFIAYWLTPNADGTSFALKRGAWYVSGLTPNTVKETDAAAALDLAMRAPAVTVAQNVRSIRASVDTGASILALIVDGGDNSGQKSSLSLSGNSYVRN